ncbi:hypothetical protein [Actinocatenispora rupis]|uniref:Tetratricopeptide repeat-containing protein n=1 Tax=Actinocatenispora rupis TaxID=519421 RepID=A0A8J3J326_9ACTN|nr:hypothetical protein [Actinocatenispora rupis]GID14906.1 hypothetical protein Aru02nite_57950 [Actinocatenispora rupis]
MDEGIAMPHFHWESAYRHGVHALARGRKQRAIEDLERARDLAERAARPVLCARAGRALGDAYRVAGREREAVTAYKLAAAMAQTAHNRLEIGLAHRDLGDVAAARGDTGTPVALWRCALNALSPLRVVEVVEVAARLAVAE